jgi:TrmH family RNA methyltransferase
MRGEYRMIFRISSRSNERVKSLLKEKDDYYFFEGKKLVNDILERNIEVSKLIVNCKREGELEISENRIKEIWFVSETVMKKISFLKEKPDFIAVKKIKRNRINFSKSQLVFVLDNIQDPANAGTIFRCAAAFGYNSIAFTGSSVKVNNNKFLRAAQTSIFDINFQSFINLETLLKKSEIRNFNVYLTSSMIVEKMAKINEMKFPSLIIFGNEGKGLNESLFKRFPTIRIAQTKKIESLNVGISACIIMHEIFKTFKLNL